MKGLSVEGYKIILFSRSYSNVVGGVEKLSLRLASSLIARGAELHLISFDDSNAIPFFDLPNGLIWHKIPTSNIDLKSSWTVRFFRLRNLRKLLKEIKPDVFIGFQVGTFLLMRIAAVGLPVSSIAAERNAPTLFNFIKWGLFKYYFYQVALHSAKIITVQFQEYKYFYLPTLRKRIRTTPNSVTIPYESSSQKLPSAKLRILYVGRLTYQKNIEVLLRALQLLDTTKFKLTIVGEGPDCENLKAFALNAELDVVFIPFSKSLENYYRESDVFCLPSRWEGFPNVVAEALAHGLPVIGFQESAGVSALVRPGINGELASGNSDAVSLSGTLGAFDPRSYSGQKIIDSIKQFDESLFDDTWQLAVLDSLTLGDISGRQAKWTNRNQK
jgi:glycosyltransferase involved in cell wall biosynthesis